MAIVYNSAPLYLTTDLIKFKCSFALKLGDNIEQIELDKRYTEEYSYCYWEWLPMNNSSWTNWVFL